jgi:hypothetical protein
MRIAARSIILLSSLCSLCLCGEKSWPSEPLPPIQAEDRFLFGLPDRRTTLPEWQYLCDLERRLYSLGELNRLMRRPIPSEEMIAECIYIQQAWNLYDNVAIYSTILEDGESDAFARNAVVENLERLRDHIGWRNYYAGRMPSTQRLRAMDAALNQPW